MPKLQSQLVDVVIDDTTLAGDDVFALVEPLWDKVRIYGSWDEYMAGLSRFSVSQRHLFAIRWYGSEVCNGGHHQFFSNPTGMVWEHAVEGFEAIGMPEAAENLRTASARLGGASRDGLERQMQLKRTGEKFGDLDTRFYELDDDLPRMMLEFARRHPSDFYYTGPVKRYFVG